jgi:hypothetical protein
MHSLEMIVFLNCKRQAARAHRVARLFNLGNKDHAKSGEKTGTKTPTREDWITHGEWEARKRKRKTRRY